MKAVERITRRRLLILAPALWAVSGCRRSAPPPPPPPATRPADLSESEPAAAYARYLAGMRICLDPGHGGDADRPGYKRGPTGLREAEVNLRVALMLREMLAGAGAAVFMTRETDTALADAGSEDLRLRAEVANRNDCDLLLSIHHNASDTNPQANFTSVWYHGDVDCSPASLDVARYLAVALIDALDLPQTLGCPVLSDELVSRSGFAVLRHARVPAVLTEASFHSNPDQERKLADPGYNRLEARALFAGLARYAYGGLPRARLVVPADGAVAAGGSRSVQVELQDGLSQRRSWGWERRQILRDSIRVRLGDRLLPHVYEEQPDRVWFILPPDVPPGRSRVNLQFQNVFKHSNTRPELLLELRAGAEGAS